MIVACHQPNFAPHPAFFAKIAKADLFTISDSVLMSNRAFFNYNYLMVDGERKKITVPVHKSVAPLKSIRLCDWEHNRKKILKTIEQEYRRTPYFNEFYKPLQAVILGEYNFICELNLSIIRLYMEFLGIPKNKLVLESELGIDFVGKNDDIIAICKKLDANCYLSGAGGANYLDLQKFADNCIDVEFLEYPVSDEDLSIIDHCFRNGGVL